MHTVTFYSFSELSEHEQEEYFNAHPDKFTPDYEWWDCTLDDIKTALEIIGFNDVEIFFSGFCSQGDGACFTGDYSYRKGALAKVKKDYPQWEALHTLVKALQDAQKNNFYAIRASLSHSGRYYHEQSISFSFEDTRDNWGNVSDDFDEDSFIDPCREFMQEIYFLLEKEYEYLSSWEYVKECPECFDYIQIEKE